MLTENPSITIAYPATYKPSLITGVGKFGKISTEEFNIVVQTANVILATMNVRAEKVTGESVTEPIANSGLDCPMLPATVMAEGPCVKTGRYVKCPLGSEAHFYSCVNI